MGRHGEHPQGVLAQLELSPEKGPPGRASGTQRKPVKESALRLGWPNKVHSRHSFLAASASGAFGLLQGCLSVGHSLVVCMLGSSARLTTLDNKLANQAIPAACPSISLLGLKLPRSTQRGQRSSTRCVPRLALARLLPHPCTSGRHADICGWGRAQQG